MDGKAPHEFLFANNVGKPSNYANLYNRFGNL